MRRVQLPADTSTDGKETAARQLPEGKTITKMIETYALHLDNARLKIGKPRCTWNTIIINKMGRARDEWKPIAMHNKKISKEVMILLVLSETAKTTSLKEWSSKKGSKNNNPKDVSTRTTARRMKCLSNTTTPAHSSTHQEISFFKKKSESCEQTLGT